MVEREWAREAVALLREQAARVQARAQRESRQHLPGRRSRRGRRRAFSNRGSARGLDAAKPFLRRAIGGGVRLRRVPEVAFEYDRGVEYQDRVEQILQELAEERRARGEGNEPDGGSGEGGSGAS